jgi:hypothetical protein
MASWSSIINPLRDIRAIPEATGEPMVPHAKYNHVMTVEQMIDLVAFLQLTTTWQASLRADAP